jgi:hypothetical protein
MWHNMRFMGVILKYEALQKNNQCHLLDNWKIIHIFSYLKQQTDAKILHSIKFIALEFSLHLPF